MGFFCLTACTGGPKDDAIKAEVWTPESLKAQKMDEFYEMGSYKVVKKENNELLGSTYQVTVEQKGKLLKDCAWSTALISGLAPCGQTGYYEKKEAKAGKEITLTYHLFYKKNTKDEIKPAIGFTGGTANKVDTTIYQ